VGRRLLAMKKCFLYFKEGVSVLAEADLEKCALKAQMSWLILTGAKKWMQTCEVSVTMQTESGVKL